MTQFENKVFEVVKKIPRGEVLTYKQVALKLGNAGLARAVGNALSRNRDKKVPCHRVIGSEREIGGFNKGVQAKMRLLAKEGYLKTKWRGKWKQTKKKKK